MKRRLVLATCLAGIIAGSAGAAMANPVQVKKHDVCIAITQDNNYNAADYYCVDVHTP
jgi:hypothetical protein